jgi:uncharacterized RDD family membrane protein YckC
MEPESGESGWDQLSIDTPELVTIEMPVAGIGSRFIALLVDYLIWLALILVLFVLDSLLGPSAHPRGGTADKWATAIIIFLIFLLYWGYFTLFEAFWNGRTPGKRVARIRVIQRSGRGISLFEAMTRNLLRFIDFLPLAYGVGVISIFLTRQQQRLGDLAAGTIVVHERENLIASTSDLGSRTFTAGLFDAPAPMPVRKLGFEVAASGIQRLGSTDLELLEGFFARRLDFTLETRAALAQRIAGGIQVKTGLTVPPEVSVETFLEEVARQLRDVVRLN